MLQFRLILAGGIKKRAPGLGLQIEGVAKQLLNGLPLLAHLFPFGGNRPTAAPAIAKQK